MRGLGKGGFGTVQLWEKAVVNGPPIRPAVKDTNISDFFADYCAEAQFTRRINDAGCPNVIHVWYQSFQNVIRYLELIAL